MFILVNKTDNLVVGSSTTPITLESNGFLCGDVIHAMAVNALTGDFFEITMEVVTVDDALMPIDFRGGKYTYLNGVFTLVPENLTKEEQLQKELDETNLLLNDALSLLEEGGIL